MIQAATESVASEETQYYLGAAGDRSFRAWCSGIAVSLRQALSAPETGGRLFRVESSGIFEFYLSQFEDAAERQYHHCHCCETFLRRYGGLVTLDRSGRVTSALWDLGKLRSDGAPEYGRITLALQHWVVGRPVADEFFWKDPEWGASESGGFAHLHVRSAEGRTDAGLTCKQTMALRRQERRHLQAALEGDLPADLVRRAVALLQAGGLSRAEKLLPMGLFLRDVHGELSGVKDERRRDRILWAAVGRAARGWCTPRGSAFGALCEDVRAGKDVREISRAHDARLAPDQYQRPQAPPKAGNVRAAEKLFEELGLAPALERRHLALEEAEMFWTPARGAPTLRDGSPGVFSHLEPKAVPSRNASLTSTPQRLTFAKFERDVLPKTLRMKIRPPAHGAYCALTTAVHPDAPPILQWDSPEGRNPAAWYLYTGGSPASRWDLSPNAMADVAGLCKLPPDWLGQDGFRHQTAGRVLFAIEGCRDVFRGGGLALFPESLKSELHAVRATIEAHSTSRQLVPLPEDSRYASGLLLGAGDFHVDLEVVTADGTARYLLDRLE